MSHKIPESIKEALELMTKAWAIEDYETNPMIHFP